MNTIKIVKKFASKKIASQYWIDAGLDLDYCHNAKCDIFADGSIILLCLENGEYVPYAE